MNDRTMRIGRVEEVIACCICLHVEFLMQFLIQYWFYVRTSWEVGRTFSKFHVEYYISYNECQWYITFFNKRVTFKYLLIKSLGKIAFLWKYLYSYFNFNTYYVQAYISK